MLLDSDPLSYERLNQEYDVSRETYDLLKRYVETLLTWQKTHNLIGNSTVKDIWTRHILDSMQLVTLADHDDKIWVDIGSGGGLPGLILAIVFRNRSDFHIHLIESHQRKAAFLQHCVTLFSLPATIHAERIENMLSKIDRIDVLTARALASLEKLFFYASHTVASPRKMFFLKGKDVHDELTQSCKSWRFNYNLVQSRVDSTGTIVIVSDFSPAA